MDSCFPTAHYEALVVVELSDETTCVAQSGRQTFAFTGKPAKAWNEWLMYASWQLAVAGLFVAAHQSPWGMPLTGSLGFH